MTLPLATVPKTDRPRNTFGPKYVVPIVLMTALLAVASWFGWQAYRRTVLPGTPATAEIVEAQYGIRITYIAVLAGGGLIDFRFQVIDSDKAAPLFNLDKRPILFVEKTGQVVDSLYHPPHSHNIVAGQSQYFIYNNTDGAIKSGFSISVLLGDLRLEHIIAQ